MTYENLKELKEAFDNHELRRDDFTLRIDGDYIELIPSNAEVKDLYDELPVFPIKEKTEIIAEALELLDIPWIYPY